MKDEKNAPSNSEQSKGADNKEQNKVTPIIGKLKQEVKPQKAKTEVFNTIFPSEGMPKVISDCMTDMSNVYSSPIEFFALSFLVACCGAVRKRAVLDDGKYLNFPQLWAMNVAPSGIGKTEPDKKAFKTLIDYDVESYQLYKILVKDWKADCIASKKTKSPEPPKPTLKQLLIDDCTPEALYCALEDNTGLTMHSDELNTWFNNIGRYAKNGEVGRYLSIFDNTSFPINRKNDEPRLVKDPLLNIFGGIQPEVLVETLQLNQMRKNGFAQRFLYAFPDRVIKPYYCDLSPNFHYVSEYESLIKYLYNTNFGTLFLSKESKAIFITFANEMTDLCNDTDSDYLKSMCSKFNIHCLRLSLILELINTYPNGLKINSISYDTMTYAISLCRYFISCGLKIDQLSSTGNAISSLNKVIVAKYLVDKIGYSEKKAAEILNISQQYINREIKNV